MKRLAAGILLASVCLLLAGSAAADPAPMSLKQLMGVIHGGSITIPPEWDGIWDVVDSSYTCTGTFQGTDTYTDTLCSGGTAEPDDGPVPFSCSGSATATTVDMTCTGSEEVVTDCTLTFTYHFRGTRTGNTYFIVNTVITSYDGKAPLCDLFQDSCNQINMHGTRTGPAPPAYCATPALPSSWGELKIRYR